jgi:hypothetical protein
VCPIVDKGNFEVGRTFVGTGFVGRGFMGRGSVGRGFVGHAAGIWWMLFRDSRTQKRDETVFVTRQEMVVECTKRDTGRW